LKDRAFGGLVQAHREWLVGEQRRGSPRGRRGTNVCLGNTIDAVVTKVLNFRRGIDVCLDTLDAVATLRLNFWSGVQSRRGVGFCLCLGNTIDTVATVVAAVVAVVAVLATTVPE
jgi:hypothetical protein